MYLSRYEEPLFEAFSQLRLEKIDHLCQKQGGAFVRENMDVVLSNVADKLIIAAIELSKTYFSHYDE
jgi:hypothetical protein